MKSHIHIDGRWQMADGRWQMADGRWQMARSLPAYTAQHQDHDTAMANAYRSGGYTMKENAAYFGVHYMTVSRAVRKYEQTKDVAM